MLGFWWIVTSIFIAGILVITILGEITKSKISTVAGIQSAVTGKDLHAKIKEVQPDTVKFGLYDKNGNHVHDVEMSSVFDYVNSRIKVGDNIY